MMYDSRTRLVACLTVAAVFLALCSSTVQAAGSSWNATCPSPCRCAVQKINFVPEFKRVRTMDCMHRKLKQLPDGIPDNVEALLIKDNGIQDIDSDTFQSLSDLLILDLSYNFLSALGPPSVFRNLTSLQILNLEGNRLRQLRQGTFSGLTQLEELVLSLNGIQTIEKHAFQGLDSLKTLVMNHNRLKEIRPEWFGNLPSLQDLRLDNNLLTVIEGISFISLTSLTKLSLSHNNLSSINIDSFMGLKSVNQLDLSYNKLTAVPSQAFHVFRRLKLLTVDGNAMEVMKSGSFQGLSAGELSLSNISTLVSLDRQSVVNMPELHTLRVHSNRKLKFVHPQSLQNLPKLEELYLHDNGILALPSELVLSLPSLQQISFYGNPLQCDCNIYWIKSVLSNKTFYTINDTLVMDTPPVNHLTFQKPLLYICDSPLDVKSMPLSEVPLSSLTDTCGPKIIPLFESTYQRELGKDIVYECRAIGVPFPHIHWILSNGKIMNNTSNYSRIRLNSAGTLAVNHLKAQDAGTYTCVATNSIGYDTKNTVLSVHSKNIQIISKGSTNNFITVSWNGTESTIATSDYMILYRSSSSEEDYRRVHLRPYMRKYTISSLSPDTAYEFCIAYEHSTELVKLNCITIRTKNQLYMMHGIRTISKLTILLALCLTSLGVIFICVLMVIVRRYQRRKSYQDPGGSANGAACCSGKGARPGQRYGPPNPVNYKVGQISNIPLDNLYNPPTTPLCTSTTSLISTQSNA